MNRITLAGIVASVLLGGCETSSQTGNASNQLSDTAIRSRLLTLDKDGRADLEEWLVTSNYSAFAISINWVEQWGWSSGYSDVQQAQDRALHECKIHKSPRAYKYSDECEVVAENGKLLGSFEDGFLQQVLSGSTTAMTVNASAIRQMDDAEVCTLAISVYGQFYWWNSWVDYKQYVAEAKLRGYTPESCAALR